MFPVFVAFTLSLSQRRNCWLPFTCNSGFAVIVAKWLKTTPVPSLLPSEASCGATSRSGRPRSSWTSWRRRVRSGRSWRWATASHSHSHSDTPASRQLPTDLLCISGDGRSQAHRRQSGGEGASEGASERTGHADQHRALAGDGPLLKVEPGQCCPWAESLHQTF